MPSKTVWGSVKNDTWVNPRGKRFWVKARSTNLPTRKTLLVGAKHDENSSALISKKSHKAVSKEENQRLLSGDRTKEKSTSSGVKKEKEREDNSIKKFYPPWRLLQTTLRSQNTKSQRKPNQTKQGMSRECWHKDGGRRLVQGKWEGF